jgi:hypothetical protein
MSAHMSMKRALLDQDNYDPPRRSASVAGSEGSVVSSASFASCVSYRSVDPRGSRRGRKGWASASPFSDTAGHSDVSYFAAMPDATPTEDTEFWEGNMPVFHAPISDAQSSARDQAAATIPDYLRVLYPPPIPMAQGHKRDQASAATERHHRLVNKGRFFCTWPKCSKTFLHRSQWTRHEEARHYSPNIGHFTQTSMEQA